VLALTAEDSYNGRVPATPAGYRKIDFRFNVPGELVLQADGRVRAAQVRLNAPFFIMESLPLETPHPAIAPGVWE
jgi:hypothetical protein